MRVGQEDDMEELENREAAFLGKLTAVITHELRNVLAIIKETSGLAEDVLAMNDQGPSPQGERLSKALSGIGRQVQRGNELIDGLNHLAHTPDTSEAQVQLNDQAAQMSVLAQRIAKQKKVSLEAVPSDANPSTVINPLRLQMTMLAAIECCLEVSTAGASVTIEPGLKDGKPAITFCIRGSDGGPHVTPEMATSPGWTALSDTAQQLGVEVKADDDAGRVRLVLPLA